MKFSACVLLLLAGLAPELVQARACKASSASSASSSSSTKVAATTSSSASSTATPLATKVSSVVSSASSSTSSTPTLSTVKASATTASSGAVSTSTSGSTSSSGFAKTNGLLFEIDGVTQYYAGTNCYYCGFLTADGDVDTLLSDIASAGLKILRVWGFNDVTTKPTDGTVWYQYLSSSGSEINTGADGLERLDYVVKAAETNDLKLIINFVNNWSDYGGMAAYVSAFGLSATTDWYTSSVAQAQYQAYIAAVVSRYSNSSAVFAWELANEPRCTGCDTSVIYDWAKNTSAYIKSLDPDHMVTLGDEGFGPIAGDDGSYPFTTSAGGYSFVDNLDIDTLDFGTLHLYPDSWGTEYSWGELWITEHGAACANASKPCLLEEYGGGNNCTVENPWQATALATTGFGGDMFWQFGDVLPSTGAETSQDGNTAYFNTTQWTCMVTDHIAAIDKANAA